MPKRKPIPPALRKAVIAKNGGICPVCGEETEKWEVDHLRPVALGGTNEEANLQAICSACHLERTVKDVKGIAKANRIRAKRLGTKPKRWVRKIGGGTVWE